MKIVGTKLKLICKQDMTPHWGSEFIVGNQYDAEVSRCTSKFIHKPKEYWESIRIIAQSIDWIRKGYTSDNMHEVMPDYITYREMMDKYTIKIEVPIIVVNSEKNTKYTFSLISQEELIKEYGVEEAKFTTSVNYADEYFELVQVKREHILNILLNQ